MDTRWFMEDRQLPKEEQEDAKAATEKALKNSTLLSRRLARILNDEVTKTYLKEEDYEGEGWKRKVLSNSARRKAFNEIIKLLP